MANEFADSNNIDKSEWDVFISYASEDRLAVANPLAHALKSKGVRVWYDQFEIKIGDSLFASISEGLRLSKFGIVILSPNFFAKEWTQRELRGLFSLSTSGKRNSILPVWYQMGEGEINQYSPLLSDIVAARWEDGIDTVVQQILSVLSSSSEESFIPISLSISAEVRRALSKADYAARIENMAQKFGVEEVCNSLSSVALDIDQTVWIRIRALQQLVSLDGIEASDWTELLQQPITELLEGIIGILTEAEYILTQEQIHLLFSNPALPRRSTGNVGEMIEQFVRRGAEYTSNILLPLSISSSWEIKYNCVKSIITLNDRDTIPTLAHFSTMSYWQARRRIIDYLVLRYSENSLSGNEREIAIEILNQIITDGRTELDSRVMGRAKEALEMIASKPHQPWS